MYELFQMVLLGFVIGLTGALAPGPTLVATINASIAGDWTTGLKVSLGHAIVELFLVMLILLGLATVALLSATLGPLQDAAASRFPVGGDHGAHDGIEQVVDYFKAVPADTMGRPQPSPVPMRGETAT